MSKLKLKDYQKEILKSVKRDKKGVMFVPTRLGKKVVNLNGKSSRL